MDKLLWLTPPHIIRRRVFVDPRSEPGLGLWADASRLSLANLDPVATWTDLSGNANHGTQATGGNQPVFETNVQNSLPGVHFTAASSHFLTVGNAVSIQFGEQWTVFFVWKAASNARQTILGHNDAVNGVSFEANASANVRNAIVPGNFMMGAGAGTDGTTTEVLMFGRSGTSIAQSFISKNGVALTVSGIEGLSTAGNGTKDIGRRAAASQHLNGWLFEIIVYPKRFLSAAARANINAQLVEKWAVS